MSDMSNREFKTELFGQFARVSQALSSGKRLEILELLAQGERSVDALTQLTGMTAANTSQHLQQLRKAGLVASRKDGLFVIYRIAGGGVVRLLMALREIVAYCRGPYCLLSYDAVEMLRAKGRKARRLAEGYPEWQSAGLPVDRGAPESVR